MIGDMLILSGALTLFILLGIAGKWRVEHDAKLAKQRAERLAPKQAELQDERDC